MRIILISSSIEDFYYTPHRASNLGPSLVAEQLRKSGHSVWQIDFSRGKVQQISLPAELCHLKHHLYPGEFGPIAFFSSYKRFGPSAEECAKKIAGRNPDLVLISSFAFAYADPAIQLAKEFKRLLPGIPLVAGGAGPSVCPGYYESYFDCVFSGEIEQGAHFGPITIDKEPEGILPTFRIMQRSSHRIAITASVTRGCPMKCEFCSNHLVHGRTFRRVSISRIRDYFDHLRTVIPNLETMEGIINFEDDNLTWEWEYFNELIQLVSGYFLRCSFLAENGLDYRTLTPEKISRLTDAGFRKLNLSLGTLSSVTARQENRIHQRDLFTAIVKECETRSIPVISYFICGLRGDTPRSVTETLLYLSSLPTEIGISLYYPVPGKELAQRHHPVLFAGSSAFPWNGSLSTSQLITAFRLSRLINTSRNPRKTRFGTELIQRSIESQQLFSLRKEKGMKHFFPVPELDTEMCRTVLRELKSIGRV